MKNAASTFACAALLLAATAHAEVAGRWTARQLRDGDRLHLELARGRGTLGQTMPVAAFSGLTAGQVAGGGPAAFALRREAGTVTFRGSFRDGRGSGDFAFVPNPAYLDTLRELGVAVGTGGRHGETVEDRLLSLAVLDVSTDFVAAMQRAGYDESLDDYIAMRIFGVTPALVAEYAELGMRLSADELVAGQIHGVSPSYVARMRELDPRVGHDELVASRIHGATPEFIARMGELGYGDLDLDDYVAFRIHGVSPAFVEELAEVGYADVDADDLLAFRIHGVDAELIRELAGEGYRDLTPEDLVDLRIHGRWRRR